MAPEPAGGPVGTGRGLLELARPGNAVAAGGLSAIGAYVAGGAVDAPWAVAAAVAATVLATAAGNAINDYFDREVDRLNQPGRPIPRGAVAPRTALAYSLALFAAAVALALTLPVLAVVIAAVNLTALLTYTSWFKGRPGAGNALVAYLGGSTFLFGGAAVGDVGAAGVLFALAALATFAREVVKDVEDLAGDAAEGLRTLPVAVGERRALWLGAAALVAAVLASPWPYLDGTFGVAYLALVVPADLVMLYAAAEAFSDPSAGQTHLKYGMFLAAAAFVVGRAFA
ncbi:MAG: geranylgeranylglycerol-phosphate geranylgeranyltransferase [Halobacteriales archaeon]